MIFHSYYGSFTFPHSLLSTNRFWIILKTEKDAVRPCVLHCFPCSVLQCFPLAVFSHHQRATIGHNMPKYAKIGHKGLNKQKTKKTKKTKKPKKTKKTKISRDCRHWGHVFGFLFFLFFLFFWFSGLPSDQFLPPDFVVSVSTFRHEGTLRQQ